MAGGAGAIADAYAVPSVISGGLGIAPQAGRAALEALLDALAPQDILIVLDNCEHLIDACAKTADALLRRCPRVHLVATSREPLGITGETIYRVPSLSLPASGGSVVSESSDAVARFVDRARAQGAGVTVNEETVPVIVSICRRLDGLPLAIELAAARLRSLSLVGLHDRLDQRFRLLTGESRTALGRQQTLRATVDWSYSLLNGAGQSLLRRLSAFADTFDLDAAEAGCGFADIEMFDIAELLGALVDKSLVVAEPAGGALRYRLLETIRQFAAERLAEAGEDEAGLSRRPTASITARQGPVGIPAEPRPGRPGPFRETVRRGHRLHRAIRRPAVCPHPAQQRRRARAPRRGHPCRSGPSGSGGPSLKCERGEQRRAGGQPGLGAAPGRRPWRRAVQL